MSNAARYGWQQVEIRIGCRGEGVTLAVADNGPGVPPGHGRNIFDEFNRARTDDGRTRLSGLASTSPTVSQGSWEATCPADTRVTGRSSNSNSCIRPRFANGFRCCRPLRNRLWTRSVTVRCLSHSSRGLLRREASGRSDR